MLHFGPFVLTNELSVGAIAQIILLLYGTIKGLRYFNKMEARLEILWTSLNGEGPADSNSWFHRLAIMEEKVNQLWVTSTADRRSSLRIREK